MRTHISSHARPFPFWISSVGPPPLIHTALPSFSFGPTFPPGTSPSLFLNIYLFTFYLAALALQGVLQHPVP